MKMRASVLVVAQLICAQPRAEEDGKLGTPLAVALMNASTRAPLPNRLLGDFRREFSSILDFDAAVAPHTWVELVPDEQGRLAVVFISGQTTQHFYAFTPPGGTREFFDPEGRSGNTVLLRKPTGTGVLQAGFGTRRHPILGYERQHLGVDWEALPGVPVLAAGSGVVSAVHWDDVSGYVIAILHDNTPFETRYAHLSAFGNGIALGQQVGREQIIGYVGSTGLSTGPHLHYELRVAGEPVDPLIFELPAKRVLTGDEYMAFSRERLRLDGLRPAGTGKVTLE